MTQRLSIGSRPSLSGETKEDFSIKASQFEPKSGDKKTAAPVVSLNFELAKLANNKAPDDGDIQDDDFDEE